MHKIKLDPPNQVKVICSGFCFYLRVRITSEKKYSIH